MVLRQMEIVTDVDKLHVDIQATCMKYKTIKEWAYINHDKDDTRPHYHIYLNFGTSSCDTAMVAKWFEIEENFIEKVKGRKADILLYLTHGNDSQQNKHQYSPDEVIANFDFKMEIESAKILGDFEKYSYAQQLKYVNSLPLSEKAQMYTKLKKLWELHCQCLTLKTDRKLQVVFICGKGGTGKTYYAKKLLSGQNYDFCVSSSSNDPFQDYMGQKAIILDDLRDDVFDLDDLLKILDNDTLSSVRSRFANKVFNGEMIAITSPVPLVYWYKSGTVVRNGVARERHIEFDTLDQLYRRISCYVVVTEKEVVVYNEGVDKYGKPKGDGEVYENEVYGLKGAQREKFDFKAAFDKICKRKETPKQIVLSDLVETNDNLPF
ncbi:Rep family protein [Pumilibacter muris]|uniref:Rep family protein n=1 Tax=Pumilibacter muris TaxID=2941510 RepID=UPI00203CFB05|nr:Rep family protein [Pumilibacter muris]